MQIVEKTFSFVSKWDGVTIHGTCMIPEQPIGILQMVHGMSEHEGRYHSFMHRMAEKGYITLMHDNRGHGKSVQTEDDLGYCYASGAKGFVEDIYMVTKRIRREYPELPLVLYGHSMGSLAVRAYLRGHDDAIDGLVISGCPGYNDAVPFGKFLVKLMMLVRGVRYRSSLIQTMTLGGFDRKFRKEKRQYAWLAVNETVAEQFMADPLCGFTYTLNGFQTVLDLETLTYKAKDYPVKNPNLPILFLSGEDDPCYLGDKKWYQAIDRLHNLGYEQTTAMRFPGMRHEIHNEEDQEIIYDEIDRFFKDNVLIFNEN